MDGAWTVLARFRWLLRLSTVPSRTQWKQGLGVSVPDDGLGAPWDVNLGKHVTTFQSLQGMEF